MTSTVKNWPQKTYTNSTWTDLVVPSGSAAAIVVSVTVASPTNAGTVKLQLTDASNTELALIVAGASVLAGGSYAVDLGGGKITVQNGQKLRFWADAAGMSFMASGAEAS